MKNLFMMDLEKIITYNHYYREKASVYYEKELKNKINYERLRDVYDKSKSV